jgi:O-antigen/teichoic acid export membrane protein
MSGRKLIKGTVWGLAGQATTVAASAVFTPIVVRQLGASAYGILVFLNLLTSYLAYSDLGMGTASTRFASIEVSAGSNRETQVIWTGVGLSTIVAAMVAVLIIVLAPAISNGLLHVESPLRGQTIAAMRIVGIAFLFKNIAGVLNTPQLVRLRFDTYTAITSGVVFLQVMLTPIVLWLGGDLVTIALMIAVINFCALGLHFVVGRRLLPELWPPRADAALFWPLLHFGVLVVFSQIPELILANAERFGLAYFTSVAKLGYYSLAYTYASLTIVAAIAMGQVLLPMFSQLQSSADAEQLGRLYRRSIVSLAFTLAPIAVVLAIVARPVLATLVGQDYGRESTPACYVLLGGVVFGGLSYVPLSLLFASNKGSVAARIRWYELVPYFMVAAFLTKKFGIVGAAAAWTLRALVDSLLLTLAVQRWKGLVSFSVGSALRYAGALAFLVPPIVLVAVVHVKWMWAAFLTCGCLMLYVFNLWRHILTASEKFWVAGLSRRILPPFVLLR